MFRLPYRRRNYLIKHWFQARFALYPIAFLAFFLGLSGVYLHRHLSEYLRLQMYMPHSHLGNPWEIVAPALARVVLWGGAAFVIMLIGWVWVRFRRLHSDLESIADWMGERARLGDAAPAPRVSDEEIRTLSKGLSKGTEAFRAWEEEVVRSAESVLSAVDEAVDDSGSDLVLTRTRLRELRGVVETARVDEGMS